MKKTTFLFLGVFLISSFVLVAQPATSGTLNLSGCNSNDTQTTAYDGSINSVIWFELIYDGSACNDLIIDTVSTSISGNNDTEIGIFDSSGMLIGFNDDIDGAGNNYLSALDLTSVLSTGTYYIATGGFNMTFANGFTATSSSTDTGNITVNASTGAVLSPPTTDATINLSGCNGFESQTIAYDGSVQDVIWIEFIYDGSSCDLLTIDTISTSISPENDTILGIYNSTGLLIDFNDDIDFPNNVLSSIDLTNVLSAGTYYIAVGGWSETFDFRSGFNAVSNSIDSGNITVNATSGGETLSTNDFTISDIKYYPNPVVNQLNISAIQSIDTIEVYNMLGQRVYADTPKSNAIRFDMSSLQSGAYFVRLTAADAAKTIRIIKK